MSRKYNCKHPERGRNSEEGTSGYQKRLRERGLGKAPHMLALDTLRTRQLRRVRETCTLGPEHDGHKCNGLPFPFAAELETDGVTVDHEHGSTVELVDAKTNHERTKSPASAGDERRTPKDTRPPRAPRDGTRPSPRERAPRVGTPRGR